LVIRKINCINNGWRRHKKSSVHGIDNCLTNYEYEALAERCPERIIGRMIDISHHILAEEKILNMI